jgi:hypothetical protein
MYVRNNPVNLTDPEGKWIAQAIGSGIGAIVGGYSAYRTGGDWGDILRSVAVGGTAGVLSTIPIPGLNPLLSSTLMGAGAGFLWNVGTQLWLSDNSCSNGISWDSAGLSALTGMLGGFVGGGLSGITNSQGLQIFTEFWQDIIGNTTSGVVASGLDVILH